MQRLSGIRKASQILRTLTSEPEPLDLADLSRRLDLPKSSVSDLCVDMVEDGLLHRDAQGRFSLGARLVELAAAFVGGTALLEIFMDSTVRLPGLEEEAVVLSGLSGLDVVYLCEREGSRPLPMTFKAGMRLPAWSTASGRVLLAGARRWTPDALEEHVAGAAQLIPGRLPDWTVLARELSLVAQRGYGIDDENTASGMVAIAAPVLRDDDAPPLAAVSVPLIKSSLSGSRRAMVIAAVRGLAETLSEHVRDDQVGTDPARPGVSAAPGR